MNERSAWPLVALLVVVAAVVLGAGVVLTSRGGNDEPAAGEATTAGISVRRAWTGPNRGATAVYLTIDNRGGEDRLVASSTEVAETASVMGGESVVRHTGGGEGEGEGVGTGTSTATVTATATVDLAVPAGTTGLRPGARHLMLQGLTGELQPGTTFPLRLEFEHAGPVDVEVEVVTWDEAAARLRSSYQ